MAVLITNDANKSYLTDRIENYKTLRHKADEINQEAKYLRDDIENFMIENGYEEIMVGAFKVSNKLVPVVTIDRKILERDYPEVYKQVAFVKNATRLTIS